MVKELTMDNSIFSLGANADTNVSANDASVANEFETAFETAKHNYADQKEFNNDTQKVANTAEKTIKVEKELNHKTEQTEVYKKVSTHTETKSPHTHDIDTTSQTHTEADVNGVSDTYSFTIKQSVNGERESVPKAEQEVELTSDNLNTIDEAITNEEIVMENNTSSLESTKTNAQTIAAEIVNFVTEKVSNISTSTNDDDSEECEEESSTTLLNTLAAETTENILNLTLQTTDKTVEEVIVLTDETSLDSALESAIADTEITSDTTTGAAADIELEVQTENKGIELGEGWEMVDTNSQQPLTEEELKNLVSNNTKEVDLKTNETALNAGTKEMNELNIDDVKPHTLEEIEAGKNLQKDAEFVETETENTIKNDIEIKTEADPKVEANANTEANTNVKVNANVEAKVDTEIKLENKTENLAKIKANTELDINLDSKTEESIVITQSEEIKPETDTEINNTVSNELKENSETITKPESIISDNTVEIVEKEVKQTESTNINNQEVAEIVEKVVEENADEVTSDFKVKTESDRTVTKTESVEIVETITENNNASDEFSNNGTDDKKEKEFVIGDTKENQELDLDKLINDGIKLAFVDTTNSTKETETTDVISALENKFAEDITTETEVEFSTNAVVVEEDVNTQEQVSSLEEVVNIDEFEELNVQLKNSSNNTTSNEKTSVSNTVNSTTEQLIRFSIEGETGYEPTSEFTTFKTEAQAPAQQSAPSSAKDVLAQLSEKLSTFNLRNGSKLTMQLSPENLGKIEIKLTNTSQGIIAEMTVSSDETCDMMKKNIDDLKDTLQKYGVRFDNVTVKTTATQQSTSQQDYTEQNNHQKQQHEQNKENEKQRDKSNSFEDMVNSFTNEGIEE